MKVHTFDNELHVCMISIFVYDKDIDIGTGVDV